jgi:hypothetical protein
LHVLSYLYLISSHPRRFFTASLISTE